MRPQHFAPEHVQPRPVTNVNHLSQADVRRPGESARLIGRVDANVLQLQDLFCSLIIVSQCICHTIDECYYPSQRPVTLTSVIGRRQSKFSFRNKCFINSVPPIHRRREKQISRRPDLTRAPPSPRLEAVHPANPSAAARRAPVLSERKRAHAPDF